MSAEAWFWTVMNLLMPAWGMAALFAILAPLGLGGRRRVSFWGNVGLSGLLGSVVLVLGLVLSSDDGRMLTYISLVLLQASLQWWLQGRGRPD